MHSLWDWWNRLMTNYNVRQRRRQWGEHGPSWKKIWPPSQGAGNTYFFATRIGCPPTYTLAPQSYFPGAGADVRPIQYKHI